MRVTNGGRFVIGNNVCMADYTSISARHVIIINDDVIFAPNISLHDHQHKFDLVSPVSHSECDQFAPIVIGKGVWLATRVCVMNGASVGDFSVIGSNSVVTKTIPAGSVAAGTPAKVIKNIRQ